ncbi:hypothetical protein E8E11_003770 [Didymella keratinophila]|nr:hypothetical protein E8E11_003770 [Didymella keratinophila]
MFSGESRFVTDNNIELGAVLARLFGSLFLPIFLALLCLAPRTIDQPMFKKIAGVIQEMSASLDLRELEAKHWSTESVVRTSSFPDVRQWRR